MKGFRALLPALLCTAAFSFSATLWASSALGKADAEREYAAAYAGQPLAVYSRHENGMPEITGETIREWERINGVKCVLPVTEITITASGHGFSVDMAALAAPLEKLAQAGMRLREGGFPENAWQTEILLGSAAAEKLMSAAMLAGFDGPGRIELSAFAQEASAQGAHAAVTVCVSGIAAPTGEAMDRCVWLDTVTGRELAGEAGAAEAFDRAYIYADGPLRLSDIAGRLAGQGFLAANPAEGAARTIREGQIMARQWAVLAALAFAALLLAAWRGLRAETFLCAVSSAAACAAGMLAAVLLMQASALLGWRFLIGGEARYVFGLPRCAAIFMLCAATSAVSSLLSKKNAG